MDEPGLDDARLRGLSGVLGAALMIGCVAYTIWSTFTEVHVAGFIIRMQAWGDDGRYAVAYSWVMSLLTVLGGAAAVVTTIALMRAWLVGRRAPRAVRSAARRRRLAIGAPAFVLFLVSGALAAFLLIEGRDAAESLGWSVKLVLFALPLAPFAWCVLAEMLAPAGWTQGRVTARHLVASGEGEPIRTIEVDGTGYSVSALDFDRAPEGTMVGILHTGGLFRHVMAVHTDLSGIDGPPTAF